MKKAMLALHVIGFLAVLIIHSQATLVPKTYDYEVEYYKHLHPLRETNRLESDTFLANFLNMLYYNDEFFVFRDQIKIRNYVRTSSESYIFIGLEAPFSMDEIKRAVWSCGGEKAPGPDGFSFDFIKKFWEIMKDDIYDMMDDFYKHGCIPRGCNSSFITLIPKVSNPLTLNDFRPISLIGLQYKIVAKVLANRLAGVISSVVSDEQSAFIKGRQILDGPLLLNEVIGWYKAKKKGLMLFKIDFAKAYDSLSWNYLYSMLLAMGFGNKWVGWIKACLSSAFSSVLINGSPTVEFPIRRGLRQGDPMAPFLFIIAMEGLHMAVDSLVKAGLFKCANINHVSLSHLFYADDVILVGEWSDFNLLNISKALKFFHCVSGLKINFQKSSILGVGIKKEEVIRLATKNGCKAEFLPFTYLGIPIGTRIGSVSTWNPVVMKFQRRLADWKANMLSIGGRSTLVSSVLGSLGVYYLSIFRMPKKVNSLLESMRSSFFWGGTGNKRKMAWIKWKDVIANKEDGGVGIGSLDAMNRALLYKWRWRAIIKPYSLWARVLAAIHGNECFINLTFAFNGLWAKIVDTIKCTHIIPSINGELIKRVIGNGQKTRFWLDCWVEDKFLAHKFPRLFALELDKNCKVCDRLVNRNCNWLWRREIRSGCEQEQLDDMCKLLPSSLDDTEDTWSWRLNTRLGFTVAQLRAIIEHSSALVQGYKKTRWNYLVPKKVNLFVWRMLRDGIPTFPNLWYRGVDVQTVRCLQCQSGIETSMHIFRNCRMVTETRRMVSKWIGVDIPRMSPKDLTVWMDGLQVSSKTSNIIEGIFFVWWWLLWKARNSCVHNDIREDSDDVFNSLRSTSFTWFQSRGKNLTLDWSNWMMNPIP